MTRDVQPQVGFVGGGQIAAALIQGMVASQLISPAQVLVYDPLASQRELLTKRFPGLQLATDAHALFRTVQRLLLAIKPQVFHEIGSSLGPMANSGHLIVSVIAGVSLEQLQSSFATARIIRVMPNTPCRIGFGATGYSVGKDVPESDIAWVEKVFRAVGVVVRVEERLMHAVTALSGSGPAYLLTVLEALVDGGVAAGLPRDVAFPLAVQTIVGTAKLAQGSDEHPARLRDQVTSPGGTTIAGLQVLEQRALRSAFIDAILAAAERSKELSRGHSSNGG